MNHPSRKPKSMASRVVVLWLPFVFFSSVTARGQELPDGVMQESTWMMAEVDTAKLETPKEALLERLPEAIRLDLMAILENKFQTLQNESDRTKVQVVTSMPVSGWFPTVHLIRRQSDSEIGQRRDLAYYQEALKNWQFNPDTQVRLDDQNIIVGPEVFAPLEAEVATQLTGQFSGVLQSVGDMPIRVAVIPPDYVRDTLASIATQLPEALGGFPTSVLLEGIQSVSVGFDPSTLSLKLQFQSANQDAANALAKSMPAMLRAMYLSSSWAVERLPKDVVFASIDQLPIEVVDDRVVLMMQGESLDDAHVQLMGTMVSVFAGKRRTLSARSQLRKIGLAVHNHHSAFRFLPPWQSGPQKTIRETIKEKANTQLSWRVYLLPFLGEIDLYREFHLDEPWDSPHNKTLLAKMPEIYLGGDRDIPEGYTTIVAPSSDQAILNTKEPTSFVNVVDGLSNTVMVVEVNAESAVPWTAPQDYEFDSTNPFAKLFFDSLDRSTVLFGDGSTRKLRKDLDVEQANAVFGRNDGISVTLD